MKEFCTMGSLLFSTLIIGLFLGLLILCKIIWDGWSKENSQIAKYPLIIIFGSLLLDWIFPELEPSYHSNIYDSWEWLQQNSLLRFYLIFYTICPIAGSLIFSSGKDWAQKGWQGLLVLKAISGGVLIALMWWGVSLNSPIDLKIELWSTSTLFLFSYFGLGTSALGVPLSYLFYRHIRPNKNRIIDAILPEEERRQIPNYLFAVGAVGVIFGFLGMAILPGSASNEQWFRFFFIFFGGFLLIGLALILAIRKPNNHST